MIRKSFVAIVTATLLTFGLGSATAWAGGGGSSETPEYYDQEAERYLQYAAEYQAEADRLQAKAVEMQANGTPGFEEIFAKAAEKRAGVEYKKGKAAEFKAKADALRTNGWDGNTGKDGAGTFPDKENMSDEMKAEAKRMKAEAKERAKEGKAKAEAHNKELKKYAHDLRVEAEAKMQLHAETQAEEKKAKVQAHCNKLSQIRKMMADGSSKAKVVLVHLNRALNEADPEKAVKIQESIDRINKHIAKTALMKYRFDKMCSGTPTPAPTPAPVP